MNEIRTDNPNAAPLLGVTALARHFDGVTALDGVDFHLARGELLSNRVSSQAG